MVGATTWFAFGDSLSSDQANFNGDAPWPLGGAKGANREKTTPVGSFQPNAFGLYDMHGNVFEWCQDWYHKNYDGAPTDGSAWESGGEQKERVLRGGSWYNGAYHLSSYYRNMHPPIHPRNDTGFRVVAIARPQ